jgi:long-subunit acyl-CoA synthetase (AMP-forming)
MRAPMIAVGLVLAGLVWVPTGTTEAEAGAAECVRPTGVQRIVFSAQKYPNVRRHFRGALRRGWPRRLVVNRRGADARRERLLRDIPTREGFDRDEYPPAVGRGRGPGLERGRNPRG